MDSRSSYVRNQWCWAMPSAASNAQGWRNTGKIYLPSDKIPQDLIRLKQGSRLTFRVNLSDQGDQKLVDLIYSWRPVTLHPSLWDLRQVSGKGDNTRCTGNKQEICSIIQRIWTAPWLRWVLTLPQVVCSLVWPEPKKLPWGDREEKGNRTAGPVVPPAQTSWCSSTGAGLMGIPAQHSGICAPSRNLARERGEERTPT